MTVATVIKFDVATCGTVPYPSAPVKELMGFGIESEDGLYYDQCGNKFSVRL